MNIRVQWMRGRRLLLTLFAVAVLALAATGIQTLPSHTDGLISLPQIACLGPCSDPGGGGGG